MKSGVLTIFFLYLFSFLPAFPSAETSFFSFDDEKTSEKKSGSSKEEKKSGDEDDEDVEGEGDEEEDPEYSDTLAFKNLRDIIWDVNDSLYNIPAYDLYCDWNTFSIHPYKNDFSKLKDTTFVPLQYGHQCDYAHPVEGYITSNFGPRRGRFHYGIDIKLQTGDSVYNAFDGVVRIARRSPSYGNVVVVRHNNGLETLYAHLDKLGVDVGDPVEAGDFIGWGGNTGRSTGSHLHFEVRYKGEAINPAEIICFENYILKKDTLAIHKKLFEPVIQARAAKYHTIRSGDTLGKIARRYGTSVSALCRLNNIKPTTVLRIGRRIRYN